MTTTTFNSGGAISPRSKFFWRIGQILLWLIGTSIIFCLFYRPVLGIDLFWNILIPLAPALLVFGIGFWRNICPMASTSLLPRYLAYSKRQKMSLRLSGRLQLTGVIALFLIVPLRHAIFDLNGPATAVLILSLGAIAIGLGFFYEWKSAWCSGLCPVHPVEKLYGLTNRLKLPNAHCESCHQCVKPCPDSTPGIHPLSLKKTFNQKISGILMVGAFPGFVWGWFQVPDSPAIYSFYELLMIYKMPVLGLSISLTLYLILERFFATSQLVTIFSAAAVSCYYWFRIPALFGYGLYPGDGMLMDLSAQLPEWFFSVCTLTLSLFLFGWIVFNRQKKISWVARPAFAKTNYKRKKTS